MDSPRRLRDSAVKNAETTFPPRGRRWAFRLIAIALPLVLLALVELALRVAGYGAPTAFALKRTIAGEEVFVDNQRFTERFFPPGLSRSPQPFLFAAEKPKNTTRIFVFGESAAMGDPEPSFGFARMLESLLKQSYPERNFEVLNAGITAINSHVIRDIARDLAPRQGDVWIIYMGNNEVVGPFGAGTIFGAQTPSLGFIRATLAFKKLRLGQWLDDLRHRLTRKSKPATWEGMEMFLKQQIAADDPRMAKVYAHFEANLRDIIETGAKAGAKVVLSTVASNLKDCPPFASLHGRGFSATNEWRKWYEAGTAAGAQTPEAAEAFAKAAALDDRHAELQFRLARLHLPSSPAKAAEHFRAARDLDGLRFRADTRIDEIIRNIAKQRNVPLLDAVALAGERSTNAIAGNEFLLEHVHFNFAGNHLIAGALADSVAGLLGLRAAGRAGSDVVMKQLAFTTWDELQLAEEMIKRFGQPPFTHQLDHAPRMAAWEARRDALKQKWSAPAFEDAVQTYRGAISNAPNDWSLRENFARLLQNIGEPAESEQQWRAVTKLMPHYAPAYYSLADTLDAQGKSAEALENFRRALRLKPDSVEARNGIGLILAGQGKREEGIAEIRKALAKKPDFAEARVNLGQMLAEQGQVEQARVQYEAALKYNSNSAAAHINLGKLLAQEGNHALAARHYLDALRINPQNAIAHYNLGNALTATGAGARAEAHFAEAVQHNPQFAEARYNLALHLAKRGQNEEALAQFAEVVRLKPTFAEAHFNYGVALAKSRRFDEAAQSFETVLRLQPDNEPARRFLEQARRAR